MRALLFLFFLPSLWSQPSRDERWLTDLNVLLTTLQSRHPNLYTKVSREFWDQAAASLRERIPALSDTEVAMEMARITAFAGDGHTSINLRSIPLFTSLPLRLQWFEEGWVATGAPFDQGSLVGTLVTHFDNTPIDEVVEKLRPYVSYENEWWFRAQVLNYIISPEILSSLGIQMDRARLSINGEATIPGISAGTTAGPILSQPRFPLWARYGTVNYWFHYLPDNRTIYFKYNVCAEMSLAPAARFRADLAAALQSNPVERVIIDLRNNTGGDSSVLGRLLPPIPTGMKRIAITGRQTYSSGLMAAIDLSRAGWTLVGEPTGGKPTHFGQVVGFVLPNSGLRGQFSTRLFLGNAQPQNDALLPDVPAPWTWQAFSQELDPFLDAALALN